MTGDDKDLEEFCKMSEEDGRKLAAGVHGWLTRKLDDNKDGKL